MNNKSLEAFEANIIRCNEQQALVGGNEGHSTNTSQGTLQAPSFGGFDGIGAIKTVMSVLDSESDGDWVSEC